MKLELDAYGGGSPAGESHSRLTLELLDEFIIIDEELFAAVAGGKLNHLQSTWQSTRHKSSDDPIPHTGIWYPMIASSHALFQASTAGSTSKPTIQE